MRAVNHHRSPHAHPRRTLRWSRLRRGGCARGRAGARRRGHPHGPDPSAGRHPHGLARMLLHRGLGRRPLGRGDPGHPLLRVGPVGSVRGQGGGRFPVRVPGRPHPQPVRALQRAGQVRRAGRAGAGDGIRRRRHRSLRPPERWRRCGHARPSGGADAVPGGRRRQGPVLRPGRLRAAGAVARPVPPRRRPLQGRRERRGRSAGPAGGPQARLLRHLLRGRRRHSRVPPALTGRPRGPDGHPRGPGRGHAQRVLRLHRRAAQGPGPGPPGARRQAPLRHRDPAGHQRGRRRPR